MSICQHCSGLGGCHTAYCDRPDLEQPLTRIEWFGSLQVHHPVKQSA